MPGSVVVQHDVNMESPEGRRELMVQQLVRRFLLQAQVPASEWNSRESTLLRFSMSILNSSIKGSLEYDEAKLMESMKKQAAKDGDLDRAVKLAQVLTSFQRNTDYRRKWAILQFLLRLSERVQVTSPHLGGRSVFEIDRKSSTSPKSNTAVTSFPSSEDREVSCVSNAEAWATFKKSKEGSTMREHFLLKDLVNVLQGFDGHYIKFDPSIQGFSITDMTFETPLRALAEDLASIGTVYRGLQSDLSFIRPDCGLVAQGFKAGLTDELADYAKVIALFESMVSEAAPGSMTLRRASVWLWTPRKQLTLLAELSSIAKECTGAALLNRIAQYRKHGCKNIRETTERLIETMSKPYLASLSEWVYRGILIDPFFELFIVKKNDSSSFGSAQECWTKTFTMDHSKVPTAFLSTELAEKIMITGKTLNFLHLCDSLPHEEDGMDDTDLQQDVEMDTDNSAEQSLAFLNGFDQIATGISEVYSTACKRLGSLLFSRYEFMKHLSNIRNFLLLSRGDFADALLESLNDSLNRPASSLFRHNLVGALDSSVRACAPEDSDNIVLHLDVRLHEPSPNGRQSGWDIFSLDYRIPSPLDAILTSETMREYSKLSQFLWLEKRILYTIKGSFFRLRSLHKLVRQIPDLLMDFKRLQMLHHEAMNLMGQTVQFSSACLSKSWSVFKAVLAEKPEADLDTYINLHSQYMASIKASLLTCYNATIRAKMMSILSAILKVDKACQMLEAYCSALLQAQGTTDATTLKMLTEVRAACHSSARQLQQDIDEFMNTLQREILNMNGPVSKSAAGNLTLLLDFNGYHERRGGFDASKYSVKQF